MICTGRSDYPNQVNNVLCFPYIFRGALDVGATTINEEMKLAAVERHRGARPRGALGCRRARLWRRVAHLRAGLADPQPVRSAADPAHRAGGRQGGDRVRRRDAADHRLRRLRGAAQPLRVPLRLHHEAGVRAGEGAAEARDLRRRRGRAHAARHPGRGGGGAGAPDPDRPAGDRRGAAQALRPCRSGRAAISS